MKRFFSVFSAATVIVFGCIFAGCADPNGLHNRQYSEVTFVFTNFTAAADGEYALPGDYQDPQWDNTVPAITIRGGEGSSTVQRVSRSETTFSLVPVNSWERGWVSAVHGNASDAGVMRNFWIGSIPMGMEVTVVIDGSGQPAIPVIRKTGAVVYPSIVLDGTLDADWTKPGISASSAESWDLSSSADTVNYDITDMYVTNDAGNLYVALKFRTGIALWENDRITILVDNTGTGRGPAAADGTWNGMANNVTSDGADFFFEKIAKSDCTSGCAISGAWTENNETYVYSPGETPIVEILIPLSLIGGALARN